MNDVLSQEEIDKLLNALSNGELDDKDIPAGKEKHVKNYDFKRPAKFSKEHLRTLEIIFENYARLLQTNLPVYLRKSVQAHYGVAQPEQPLIGGTDGILPRPVRLRNLVFIRLCRPEP